jgi:hypothetical protein
MKHKPARCLQRSCGHCGSGIEQARLTHERNAAEKYYLVWATVFLLQPWVFTKKTFLALISWGLNTVARREAVSLDDFRGESMSGRTSRAASCAGLDGSNGT